MSNPLKLSDLDIGVSEGEILCSLTDIDDGGAKELSYRSGSDIHDIFIQRVGNDIYAYVNICPHAGTPLNMDDGKFMEKTGKYLMCHTHGALFQLEDGFCVAGPCNGASLRPVDIKCEGNNIIAC
ncbi:Rieske (2Fe-2S) protein [Pseudemcibacter aquimaris]|uniref:Rieske (2Fe-2S) protein n=1 Tax=Pseudemcibacter aquimaris TaxID=2857064 RepID=UPI0020134F2D|nr:Rieske 2Fe-2S domain-containing protein [Pseudemcibacter aquimaris]MCC3861875.1 Rieske 2Fe-2S domain-containing protein [Pseudemcibacter aquimaris]WDU58628.1 Rieske 2Fe-2S domain-containing protein [Pseudemcibacter aquimaris]